MPVDLIKVSTQVMQSTQSTDDARAIIGESMIGIRVIGLMQGFCSLLIILGLIIGIIYMIKSKKTKGKRILIGVIIIVVPIILYLILNIVRFNMLLNR